MPERKKVLALNFFPAFTPPGSGGELRYFYIYRFLRKYYDVTLINPTHLFAEPEVVHHFPNMVEYRVPKNKYHLFSHRLFDQIAGFPECSAVVVMMASHFDKALKAKIAEHLPEADIIIHEFPFLIPLAPKQKGQILIYDAHNVEYDLQRSMLKGLFGRWLSSRVRRLERRACRTADLVFATSDEDRLRLSELYSVSPRKIIVIPNGVNTDEIRPASEEEREAARKHLGIADRPALLFFGSAHPPNTEAVEFILSELAPGIPDAFFIIAGSVCKNFEGRDAGNVRLMRRVSDTEKHLLFQAADIALNPMSSGSGTNLKMFDYLSAGLPVVTSPTGARGIPVRPYKEALICELQGFAAAINQIVAQPDLSRSLSESGRRLVVENFHWAHLSARIHEAIEDLKKPHVTVIDDFPVVPPRHGGQYRILSLYLQLAKLIPVTYLCLQKESSDIEVTPLGENFTQMAIPKGFWERVFESLAGRYLGFTIDDVLAILFAHHNKLLRREVTQSAAFGDILISVHPYQWRILERYNGNPRIYESLNYETRLKADTLKGLLGRILVGFVARAERRAILKSTTIFTVSDEEKEAFTKDFGVRDKCTTIPNGTDTSKVTPPTVEEKNELRHYLSLTEYPIALFIGSAHPPNVEAGRILLTQIAPRVPEVLFFIVGSVCWVLKNLPECPANVRLFFEVEEAVRNELFKVADIAVNPMTKGAGTSLKMFDFLAAGLPVISTPLGARGVAKPGDDSMILCEIEQFPKAIRQLVANPEMQACLRKKGRQLVEEKFDWHVIAQKMYSSLMHLQKNKKIT